MNEAVIVESVRTPIGRKNGLLSMIRPDDLAAMVLHEVVKRAGIDPGLVEDVIMGCVSQVGEQACDIGRIASLMAGFPVEVPGITIDRQCGSSQQSVAFAAQAIICGDMDVIIAAGVESMSRVPMGISKLEAPFSQELHDRYEIINQGESAERIAKKWGLSRQVLDEFSFESHQKAIRAQDEGRFEKEIMPIEVTLPDGNKRIIKDDEGPRRDTSLEKLATIKPAFSVNGVIHAGNSSQISDAAAAIILMSRQKAEELGLKPRFKVLARSVVGCDPTLMLLGPLTATKKVLAKANMSIEDIDLYEVNEAFAPVPMVWLKETGANLKKLNPCGGAIALGHPLGGSGARLMITLMQELERTGGRYGLQTMCEGFGMANATIIERLD